MKLILANLGTLRPLTIRAGALMPPVSQGSPEPNVTPSPILSRPLFDVDVRVNIATVWHFLASAEKKIDLGLGFRVCVS